MNSPRDEVRKLLSPSSFDEMLDIFDVIATYIKERSPGGGIDPKGSHFLKRIKINFIEDVTEEEPRTDYATAVLYIDAPLNLNESPADRSIREKEIKKDWFPLIGSYNVRTAKELLKMFVKGASVEALNNLIQKIEQRKAERQSTSSV